MYPVLACRNVVIAIVAILLMPAWTNAESITSTSGALSCASLKMEIDSSIELPAGLADRICSYYNAENAASWRETYELRPDAFKRRIAYDVYCRTMEESQKDMNVVLIKWRNAEFERLGQRVVLRGDFFEMPRGSTEEVTRRTAFTTLGEDTIWVNDGSWKCVACGVRTRYPLNIGIE